MERILRENWSIPSIHISAYDIDKNIYNTLSKNIASSSSGFKKSDYKIICEDFLEKTSFEYAWKINETFTHEKILLVFWGTGTGEQGTDLNAWFRFMSPLPLSSHRF